MTISEENLKLNEEKRILQGKIHDLIKDSLDVYKSKKSILRSGISYYSRDEGFYLENKLAEVNYFYKTKRIEFHLRNYETSKHKLSFRFYGNEISNLDCSQVYLSSPFNSVEGWPNLNSIYVLKDEGLTKEIYLDSTNLVKECLIDMDFEKYSLSNQDRLKRYFKRCFKN